jgi:two-component system response regulator MprA
VPTFEANCAIHSARNTGNNRSGAHAEAGWGGEAGPAPLSPPDATAVPFPPRRVLTIFPEREATMEGVPNRVLVVDDDRAIRESLARALELEGYDVVTVVDGVEALTRTRSDTFDALVVDVMLPGVDGVAVCRVLRAEGNRTPVLMLTARVETSDRVAGLDAGADDYLPKPFELDELLARLRALLRRAAPAPGADGAERATGALRVAALRVDPAARRAWWADEELALSKTEFDLLELMVRNEGIVLDHSTIYQRIWGYDFSADSKNLAVYVGYLRRKLAAAGAPHLIHTVRGVGYTVRQP